jgi:hypothetical protein
MRNVTSHLPSPACDKADDLYAVAVGPMGVPIVNTIDSAKTEGKK